MTRAHRPLPPEIGRTIDEVIAAAGLAPMERTAVRADLEAHFEDGLAAGVAPEELRVRFGDPVAAGMEIARARRSSARRHSAEDGRWWMSLNEWRSEIGRAVRGVGKAPGFTALVVLTLALGVGANASVFTVLEAVLLRPLPYHEPERLVRVYEEFVESPGELGYLRGPVVLEMRSWDEVFDGFGALYTYRQVGADLTHGDRPQRVSVSRVSAGYFEALGASPYRGRTFLEEESAGPGEATSSVIPIVNVAILSHALWQQAFGGSPMVGSTMELDGTSFEVVGIMPPEFENPFGAPADVWVPSDIRLGGSNSFGNFYLSAVARLRDGITVEAARDRMDVLFDGYKDANPDVGDWSRPQIVPLHADVVGGTRRSMLWILAAAAGLVLLTACVNVANLLLARGLSRERDTALRAALGSGRGRLMAGILTESAVLALLGGLTGLGLGWLGVRGLLSLAPDALPGTVHPELGLTVFLFALAATVLALGVFGLVPAIRLARTPPAEVLRSGDRSATAGRGARRLRDGLVVVQVAAALVLVAGAGLLMRSFNSLLDVPLGIEPEQVLTFEVHLPLSRYPDGASRHAFHETLQDRLRSLPAVDHVGAVSWLPVNGRYHSWGFNYDPENPDGSNDDAWYGIDVRIVVGDYFDAMGIELERGASFTEVDLESEPMMWVNRATVEQVFGDADPIGLQVRLAGGERRIMGVVEDIPHDPRGEIARVAYIPHAQYADNRNWSLVQTVKARGDLAALTEEVRGVVASLDGSLVLYQPRTFESRLAAARSQDRFATALMGAFAGLALMLSLVGTYGVLAGTVAGRSREIGIRMALGADQATVRSMVIRQAFVLTVPGIVLGLAGAWGGSRWIRRLLFEVEPGDPVSYGGAALLFVAIAFAAAWTPSRRATRVDPARTLTEG